MTIVKYMIFLFLPALITYLGINGKDGLRYTCNNKMNFFTVMLVNHVLFKLALLAVRGGTHNVYYYVRARSYGNTLICYIVLAVSVAFGVRICSNFQGGWSYRIFFEKLEARGSHKAGKFFYFATLGLCLILIYTTVFIQNFFEAVSIETILFQLSTPLAGTGEIGEYIYAAFCLCVIPIIIWMNYLVVFLDTECYRVIVQTERASRKTVKQIKMFGKKGVKRVMLAVGLISTVVYVELHLGVLGYVKSQTEISTIYEDSYVIPDLDLIRFPEEKRNVIIIYLESMENTYADEATGGAQSINYIPELTSLAKENISFSHTEKMGGFLPAYGCEWTMGALLGSSSGIPYALPVGGNSMGRFAYFMPGITTLGDILLEQGYKNVFLCGTEGEFAGRNKYFSQHGNYEILDYNSAIEEGYIAEDYYVFWGHEDMILYERAKDELLTLADGNEPFNFTMLTVDTHFPDGYICSKCEMEYGEQYANVIACADHQISEFVAWIREQDFYENTTIVIVGDHTSMGTEFFADVDNYERTVYNCFLNADIDNVETVTRNRIFTTLDIFPTILGSMGVQIEGERLGLGTNLFSEMLTLPEEMGIEVFEEELAKHSEYYDNFLQMK